MSLRSRRLAVLALALFAFAVPAAQAVPHDAEALDIQAGPEQGHVPARHAGTHQAATSPLLVFHGGSGSADASGRRTGSYSDGSRKFEIMSIVGLRALGIS